MQSLWMGKEPVNGDLNLWLPLVEVSGDDSRVAGEVLFYYIDRARKSPDLH